MSAEKGLAHEGAGFAAVSPSAPSGLTEVERDLLDSACHGAGEYMCCIKAPHRKTGEIVGGSMLDAVERILADRARPAQEPVSDLAERRLAYLDEYIELAQIAKKQRQCSISCGCSDCDIREGLFGLRALLAPTSGGEGRG